MIWMIVAAIALVLAFVFFPTPCLDRGKRGFRVTPPWSTEKPNATPGCPQVASRPGMV